MSIPLLKCTEADGEDWYCCPGDASCSCDTGLDAMKLGASQPTTVTVIGSTSWPGYVSTSSAFSTSAFALSGTHTIIVATTKSGSTATGTGTKTATATSANSRTSSAAAASSTDPSGIVTKSSSDTGAIAGGVVAGVLALALIGLLGRFLGRRHNRAKAARASASASANIVAEKPYAPGMGAGNENDQSVSAWAASQQKQIQSEYAKSELPSTSSHAKSEAPGDEALRHELGVYENGDGGPNGDLARCRLR